jgi:hypothetical protein
VGGGRRLNLPALLPGQLDREAIAGGVGLNARVVEHHRQHAHRLPDGLALESLRVQLGDEAGDGGGIDVADREVAEARPDATHSDPIRLHRPGGDVDAGGLPAVGGLGKRLRRPIAREPNVPRGTIDAASRALWQIGIFNQLVRQKSDFNGRHLAEIRDNGLPSKRRRALADAAFSQSAMLHRNGVGNATWWADLKRQLQTNIEALLQNE